LCATVAVTLNIFFFVYVSFVLHRQQPEKDKKNVDFAPPLEKFLRTPMGVDEAKIQLELIEFQQNVVAVKEIFLMAHLKTSCQRKAPGISKFFPLLTNGQ